MKKINLFNLNLLCSAVTHFVERAPERVRTCLLAATSENRGGAALHSIERDSAAPFVCAVPGLARADPRECRYVNLNDLP